MALLSLIEVAEARSCTPRALLAEALRKPDELPLFVEPEPPGWSGVPLVAPAGERRPGWAEEIPEDEHMLLRGPIRLTPDVLREQVIPHARVAFLTTDGESINTLRPSGGYERFHLRGGRLVGDARGDGRRVLRCVELCEEQAVPLEALLVEVSEPQDPEPDESWLSTKRAARCLRTRNTTLYGLVERGLRDGVCRNIGGGAQRRHIRWNEAALPSWWAGLPPAVQQGQRAASR